MRRSRRAREAELAKRSLTPIPGEPWFTPVQRVGIGTAAARVAAWGGLLCGPVALAACWFITTAPQLPELSTDGAETAWAGAEPAGWAEHAIAAYLVGDIDAVRVYFPAVSDAELPTPQEPSPQMRLNVARVQEVAPGYWGVTVAVGVPREDPQTPAVRHFTIGVAASGDGWTATGLPSEVAVPTGSRALAADYSSRPLPKGPVTDTVEAWARAYLAADGDLDRYLAPGFAQEPIWPTAHSGVTVRSVAIRTGQEGRVEGVPKDGDVVQVLARIKTTDVDERSWALGYALELTARSGRWEISGLAPAPPLADDPGSDPALLNPLTSTPGLADPSPSRS